MSETKFSLVDLGKLSKPISKLIDAVSQGIGTIYEPTKIRRKAKAQADAALIKAETDIKKKELLTRAVNRFVFQEMRRQENIENIIEIAVENLPETVSEDPVDKDWISRFFDDCKDVSNEELQNIWGRLLAGEVALPGYCSRKTMAILKELSSYDANIFNNICPLIWASADGGLFIPCISYHTINSQLIKFGINFDDLLHIDSLGLMHIKLDIGLDVNVGDQLKYSNINHNCTGSITSSATIAILPLTKSGVELFSAPMTKPNWQYYDEIINMFMKSYGIFLACPLFEKLNDDGN